MAYSAFDAMVRSSRPVWKTLILGGLLCLVPIVGTTMAAFYWATRHNPETYDAGQAAGAGLMVIVLSIIGVLQVVAALFVISLILSGVQQMGSEGV